MEIPILSDIYKAGKKCLWFLLKQIIKPASYTAYIRPKLIRINNQLITKYGKESVEIGKYAIAINEHNEKNVEFERGKWRIYMPLSEALFGLKENREALLIQEYIKNSFLPDLDSVDKSFKEALCVNETSDFLEKEKNGIQKQRIYYGKIQEKNESNENLDFISEMDAEKSLKPLIKTISNELTKVGRSKSSIRKSPRTKNRVKAYIKKAKEKIKSQSISVQDFDELSDDNVVKHTPKNWFEYDRKFTEKQVIDSIINGKPLKHNTGELISYCLITDLVLKEPGLTAYRMAKKLGRAAPVIKYGITALLEHKKGLGFVTRIKQGNHYLNYPSDKLKDILNKRGFKYGQTELGDYSNHTPALK